MSANHYIDILESMPLGVIVTDLSGNIMTINRYARSCMDVSDHSSSNQHISNLMENQNSIPPGNLFRIEQYRKNGIYKFETNDKIFEMSMAPLNIQEGISTGAVFIIKDITDAEKNRELEITKGKYAALEEFSADIAHEIRNPLGSIELYASLLKKELKRKKDVNRVNQIISAAKIVENKISSLILLSKTFDIPTKPVNVHEILKDILLFSEQIIDEETIFLSVKYADIEPVIECNPDMIKQVFLNLILNTLQAIPEKSRLDIVTNHESENHNIEISFIDNGSKSPVNVKSKIFERLSRTNEESSRIGLAIVHNIVNMYKGSLRIEFIEGAGTAFVLSFPLINIPTNMKR